MEEQEEDISSSSSDSNKITKTKSRKKQQAQDLNVPGSKTVKSFAALHSEIETLHSQAKITDEEVSKIEHAVDEEKRQEEIETRNLILTKLNTGLIQKPDPNYKSICKNNIERFHFLCKDLPSPDLFIDYNFYFLISACLARKVWWGTSNAYIGNLYPNLYLMFITPPGIGKSMPANTSNKILSSLNEFILNNQKNKFEPRPLLNLGPDCITFEKLIVRAASSNETCPWPNGPMKYYHHSSTTFCLGDEVGMMLNEKAKPIVSFLMKAWDCGDFEGDYIGKGVVKIKNICLNFLGCTTPIIMKDLMKSRLLDNGFTGRALFIYADKKRQKIRGELTVNDDQINEIKILINHLRILCKLPPTNVVMTPEAKEWFSNWVDHKEEQRLNQNPRLEDYYARKAAQMKKLAVLHHYANALDNKINVHDFQMAEQILLKTEPMMHKALVQAGENPIYTISEEIKLYLKIHRKIDKRKLLLDFFATGSNIQLQMAINFLYDTGQIKTEKTLDGKHTNIIYNAE